MKLIDKFVVREVGGAPVAIATGKASVKFKGYIQLNDTSKSIFELLQQDVSLDYIVNELLKQYEDADEQTIRKDVCQFLDELNGAGILENF